MKADSFFCPLALVGIMRKISCRFRRKLLSQGIASICLSPFFGATALADFGDGVIQPDTVVFNAPGFSGSVDQILDVKTYEWGQPIGGVSVSLKLLKSRYAAGEPIAAQVQLKNNSTNRYAVRNAPAGNLFSVVCVRDRIGRVAESAFSRDYGKYDRSSFAGYPLREFGGSGRHRGHHVYNLDLSLFFESLEPGRYHVFLRTQYKNNALFEGYYEGHFVELTSNTETFEIYAEPGEEVPDPSEENNADTSRATVEAPSTSRPPDASVAEANATTAGPEDTVPSTDTTPVSRSITRSAETEVVAHDSARLGVMFWVYGALILALIGVVWFFARR